MDRKIIPVSHAQLTSFDLETFIHQAKALNQRNRECFTNPFPKRPSRWISHYQFQPRSITFTEQGAIEGAPFIRNHMINMTDRAFDDFAGMKTDKKLNRKILGLE